MKGVKTMKKVFQIRVDASSRYPMPQVYQIEANSFAQAIKEAVKQYFKDHKHLRTDHCVVNCIKIMKGV